MLDMLDWELDNAWRGGYEKGKGARLAIEGIMFVDVTVQLS